jgi:hypothetical protein
MLDNKLAIIDILIERYHLSINDFIIVGSLCDAYHLELIDILFSDIDLIFRKSSVYKISETKTIRNSYNFMDGTEKYRKEINIKNTRIEFYICEDITFEKVSKILICNKYYIEDIECRIKNLKLFIDSNIDQSHKDKHIKKLDLYQKLSS